MWLFSIAPVFNFFFFNSLLSELVNRISLNMGLMFFLKLSELSFLSVMICPCAVSATAVLYECIILTELSTLLFWPDATLNLFTSVELVCGLFWIQPSFRLELNKPGFDLQVTLGSSALWSPVYTMEILLPFLSSVVWFGGLNYRVF